MQNRIFAWFVTIFGLLALLYNWMVEPLSRFLLYVPCNIVMMLPMVICIVFTHLNPSRRDIYFAYRNMHVVMATCLFVSGLGWIVGQPLVLLIVDDYLDLDPIPCLYMFMIFNLCVTTLYHAFIASSLLVLLQFLTCTIGLLVRHRPFSDLLSYVLNSLVMLIISYLFAALGAYTREHFMRRLYLVKFYQKQEAGVLRSSRLKLQIIEEGINVQRQKRDLRTSFHSISTLAGSRDGIKRPGRAALRQAIVEVDPERAMGGLAGGGNVDKMMLSLESMGPSSQQQPTPLFQYVLSDNAPLRKAPGLGLTRPQINADAESGSESDVTETDDDRYTISMEDCYDPPISTTTSYSQFTTPSSTPTGMHHSEYPIPPSVFSDDDEENLFLSMLAELPHWLWTLPHHLYSRSSRRGLWRRTCHFFKYRICMNFSDRRMERGFQEYYNPMALSRIRLLMVFAVVSTVSSIILNYVVATVDVFEAVVRLGLTPLIAISCYVLVTIPPMRHHPRLTQLICVVSCYGLFIANMLLTMQAHSELRVAFSSIDPENKDPSLIMPSNSRFSPPVDVTWIPRSPLHPSSFNETSANVDLGRGSKTKTIVIRKANGERILLKPGEYDPSDPAQGVTDLLSTPEYETSFDYRDTDAYKLYITYGIRYMSSLTGLVLYMAFLPSSAGLRFVTYLYLSACICMTVLTESIVGWVLEGPDGQSVRLVLMSSIVGGAGLFLARVLEREMRRWYAMRINYDL